MPDFPLRLGSGNGGGFGSFGGQTAEVPWWQTLINQGLNYAIGGGGGGMMPYQPNDPIDDFSPPTQEQGLFLRQGPNGYRAAGGVVVLQTPDQRLTFWRSLGRPMLWSGDMAAVKRVRRAAGKAASRAGLRRGKR